MFKIYNYSRFKIINKSSKIIKLFLNPVKISKLQMKLSLKEKSKPGLVYFNKQENYYIKLFRFFYKKTPVIRLVFRNYCFWNYYSHWKNTNKIKNKSLFGLNKNLLLFKNRIIKYKLRFKFSNIIC